jgi:3-oxoadipate enol-lactonase
MVGLVTEQLNAKVNGVWLAYQVSGDEHAPPVVLLHALGEGKSDWDLFTAELAESFYVIAADLRGHGASEWPGSYSFQLMTDDIIGLLDELGISGVTLVGHSLGGIVALSVAMERPDLVTRLIIEDVVPPYPRGDRVRPERPEGVELPFDWAVLEASYAPASAQDQAMWGRLAGISAPTLIVGGGSESQIPAEKIAEVAALIPRCDVVTIEAGHHVHSTRPQEFADAVIDWLAAL